MAVAEREQFLDELVAQVGSGAVARGEEELRKALKDNSWLSPILLEHFQHLRDETGQTLQVDAVVSPADVNQLRAAIALAVRYEVPMTPRGGGTSKFGQTIPLQGGLIVDTTRLNRILDTTADSIAVEAGALQGDVERAARTQGRELTVLTTTYASATAAGWV